MNKKGYILKRLVAFILVLCSCISGLDVSKVKASEQESIPETVLEDENVKELEQLIMKKII